MSKKSADFSMGRRMAFPAAVGLTGDQFFAHLRQCPARRSRAQHADRADHCLGRQRQDRRHRRTRPRAVTLSTSPARRSMLGFIDCHFHVVAWSLDLWANAIAPDSLSALRAAQVMEGLLANGFTTVRDLGGADIGLVRGVTEGLINGPDLVICGKGLSMTRRSHRPAPAHRYSARMRWAGGWATWACWSMASTMYASRSPQDAQGRRALHQGHGQWRRVVAERSDRRAAVLGRRNPGHGRGKRPTPTPMCRRMSIPMPRSGAA